MREALAGYISFDVALTHSTATLKERVLADGC